MGEAYTNKTLNLDAIDPSGVKLSLIIYMLHYLYSGC